ncbi:SCP-2 sterol transfer family protein [Butyrivibrio fibrisolvens DSM 3071]|uniref:SCP-2 sterol transfer family protein n=1 Tax=Butyrivibrio fibrisolvens DSM 3071 TaxID=1121131 RepID=A0A1M6D8K9_BUTFI|nr:SCP2 sterol-binding domain-containing protein [Butyrivibrio fibrisolvens]SHI69501.1 SCP-2 sterol transfer family protein [Butyrivibrio fibrisolvens DSM 3071]
MKYSEVVKTAKKKVSVLDASKIHDHLAIEFDVEGDGEGAFYVELSDGKVQVEPYEYYDNDFRVRGNADSILKLLDGGSSLKSVLNDIRIEGDVSKAASLENILSNHKLATTKKDTAKLTTTKKETKKLTTAKKESKKLTTAKKETKKITSKKDSTKKIEKKD